MKSPPRTHSRTFGMLLAAAALPLTPLAAQTTETETSAPVTLDSAPPAPATTEPTTTTTTPAPSEEPAVDTEVSADEPAATETTATTATTARRTPAPTRTATPTTAAPVAAPAAEIAPAPGLDPLAEVATPAQGVTAAAPPAPVIEPPEIIDERNAFDRALPWLILGLIVAGAALFIISRRRRREALRYEESTVDTYDAPIAPVRTSPLVEESTPTASPVAQRQPASAPAVSTLVRNANSAPATPIESALEVAPAPIIGVATGAVAAEAASQAAGAGQGRPNLRLAIRPIRAGIDGQDAMVEFELMIENRGPGRVRDLRISTWMFPAGSDAQSEAEQMLIVRPAAAVLDEVGAGERQRIQASVTLARSRMPDDGLLPVVAAEARYRTDDSGERRTSARFAVGVPVDGDLAYFDVQNPSGMHDNVEARLLDSSKG